MQLQETKPILTYGTANSAFMQPSVSNVKFYKLTFLKVKKICLKCKYGNFKVNVAWQVINRWKFQRCIRKQNRHKLQICV